MGLSSVTTQQYPERRERTVEDGRNEAYRGVDCETLGMTYPRNAESETGLKHVFSLDGPVIEEMTPDLPHRQ